MRYFYDTEFIEDGTTIDLISIGILAEDGREYYAQSVEVDHRKASEWVKENVLAHLTMCPWALKETSLAGITGLYRTDRAYHKRYGGQCVEKPRGRIHNCPWRTREQIKADILAFMNVDMYGKPELWAYYASYDHVVFCQLFGTMMDLPAGFPMYTRDLKQWADQLEAPVPLQSAEGKHNALADAHHNLVIYRFLDGYEKAQVKTSNSDGENDAK